MTRLRDLGIAIGEYPTGPQNAITDVEGVKVGYTTLIEGDGPLVLGKGPVRTGVTAIMPHDDIGIEPLFAGTHTLNGNGEMTGLEWVREAGQITTPIGITNTSSVGVVRDAIVAAHTLARGNEDNFWSLPVVGETYDGTLNDINGQHVTAQHLHDALAGVTDGPIAEGNVGGGTGMICHEFKGGTGTSSRRVGAWTMGALVQANYGDRTRLMVDGVPVGREIGTEVVASPYDEPTESGSIIVVLATDAPTLPRQLTRLAQRAGLGIARCGGSGAHTSGDIFLAFSTANRGKLISYKEEDDPAPFDVTMIPDSAMSPLFWGAIEATEEAILNALVTAETMTGIDGVTANALPHDLLVAAMKKYGRL